MARIRTRLGHAAATHRRAAALAAAAGAVLDRAGSVPPTSSGPTHQELAEQLRRIAAELAPGWLGAGLDALSASSPLGGAQSPGFVRIGTAQPLDDARFPVVLPLGHLTFSADARDPRIAGVLPAVLLRLLAATGGSLLVRVVDATGRVFRQFAALGQTGLMPPPATGGEGMRATLAEAERWLHGDRDGADRLLLVVAAWPQETDAADLARWRAVAGADPECGLQLLLAGWPPPALEREPAEQPLPNATSITLDNPHARVGDPPGGRFAAAPHTGLPAPVYLDAAPPAVLVEQVCRALVERANDHARLSLGDLLPDGPIWTQDSGAELVVPIGRAGDQPVSLRLGDATPHWLIAGDSGSGRTALLLDLLYGLCSRYGPEQLSVYLLDLTGRDGFAPVLPTANDPARLPHAAAARSGDDPAVMRAPLRDLSYELGERAEAMRSAGVDRFGELRRAGFRRPRILCLIEDYPRLLDDPGESAQRLRELLETGGDRGIHVVLAGPAVDPSRTRFGDPDSLFRRWRVRIALPGGAGVLDAANRAADGLRPGTAVVNTAGGLGGPRGATRAHEQVVHFPDPYADPVALAGLRHRLWRGAS